MLWNSIYEFYVKNVFGGYYNSQAYFTAIGGTSSLNNIATEVDFFGLNITISNYLCTIATLITIVALIIFCILIIKKIFSICFNLFTGRSIF